MNHTQEKRVKRNQLIVHLPQSFFSRNSPSESLIINLFAIENRNLTCLLFLQELLKKHKALFLLVKRKKVYFRSISRYYSYYVLIIS